MTTATLNETQAPTAAEKRFDWPLCYEAENFILGRIEAFTERNIFARTLATRMREETGTLILDWTDYLLVPASDEAAARDTGYTDDPLADVPQGQKQLWHPEAMLPRVLVAPTNAKYPLALGIRPDLVAEFVVVHDLQNEIEGEPFSRFRRVLVSDENGAQLFAVERRGYRGYTTAPVDLRAYCTARELCQTRRRNFADAAEGFAHGLDRIRKMIDLVGQDMACHLFFRQERAYWEGRNRAGREQKRRQDSLGLGWANHDHHTFRSSRKHFVDLMKAWDMLGFHRRERYYAGAQAGWGAQITEQPIEGITVFNDVDLYSDETEIDFSTKPLPPEEKKLRTIGLWVGLHGESFLDAGMHHLECRFDHALLREQLAAAHIKTMAPFSDFPFLKQAFTQGERWVVRPERITRLRLRGLLTDEQAQKFAHEGAIGSHLENLQRKGGFKGFNQKSVSVIIEATDPRKQDAVHKWA
jgi:hypothetical protein